MQEIVQKLATFIKNAAKPNKNNRQRVLFHLLSEFLQQIVIEAEASNTSKIQELQGRCMTMLWQLIKSKAVKKFLIAQQDVIPRCFSALFTFGGSREVSATIKTMHAVCDSKKADKGARLVVIKCLGEITAAHAMALHPLLNDTITVLVRQLKAGEGCVREAALCSISQVVESSRVVGSTSATPEQQMLVKALGKAAPDKSADVRTRVAACIVSLAAQIRQVAGTRSKPDSPINGLTPLFLLCQKHFVDRVYGVKLAFSTALGLLCATVVHIATDRLNAHPGDAPKAGKHTSTKTVFKQFKSKDRALVSIVNFRTCTEFLANKVNRAPSPSARTSVLHAWCVCLQSCTRCLGKADLVVLVDALTAILVDGKVGDRAQLAVSSVLRRGFGRSASEEQQLALLQILVRRLQKHSKVASVPSSSRGRSRSRSSSDAGDTNAAGLSPTVLGVLLRETSWLLKTTGNAAQGSVDRLPKLLQSYLSRPSGAVRHAAAQCIATAYGSLTAEVSRGIMEQMVEGLLVSHAELSALLATKQITPAQHQQKGAAVMGYAGGLLALMRACESGGGGGGIGCRRQLRADEVACVFGVAQNLVGFQDDPNPKVSKKRQHVVATVLRVSCIHAGWLLVVGLIHTPGWVQTRLAALINLWDASFDPISRQMPQRFDDVVKIAQCLVPALGALVTLCRLFPGAIHARSKTRAPSERGVLCSSMCQYLGCAMSLLNKAQKLMPSSGAAEVEENTLLWFRTLVLEAYYMLSPKVFKPYQKELLILAINTFVDDPDICTKTSLAAQLLHEEDFPLEMTQAGASTCPVAEKLVGLVPGTRKRHEGVGAHMFDAYVDSNAFADLLQMPVPSEYGMHVAAVVPPPSTAFAFTSDSTSSAEPSDLPPPPTPSSYKDIHIEIRAVDAAVALFAKLFAKGTSEQTKERLVSHFHTAVQERQSKQKSLLRECVEFNACVAMLAAVRWYASRLGKHKDSPDSPQHQKPSGKSSSKQSTSVPEWWGKCRHFITGFLENSEASVRRVAGESIGWLAGMGVVVIAGESPKRTAKRKNWASALVRHLDKLSKKKAAPMPLGRQMDPQKLAFQTRAGALFAIACARRTFDLVIEDTRTRKLALRILKPSVSVIYAAARETRQPVRTWMLHTWYIWLCCELRMMRKDPKAVLAKYQEPTVALIHAHILCDTSTGCRGNGVRVGLGVCLARLVELLFRCLGSALPPPSVPTPPGDKLTRSIRKNLKIWHVLWARSLDGSYQLVTAACAKAAASFARVCSSRSQQLPELRTMSQAILWQLRLSDKSPLDAASAEMLQRSVADKAAAALGCTVPLSFLPHPSFDTLRHCIDFTWQCRGEPPVWQQDKDGDQLLLRYLRSLISSFEIVVGAGLGDGPAGVMRHRVEDVVCSLIHNPGCSPQHTHALVADIWELLKGVTGSQGASKKSSQHKLRMERDEDDDEDEGQAKATPAPKAIEVEVLGGARLRWQTKVLAAGLLQQVLRESACIAARPDADEGMRAHFDLAQARQKQDKRYLVNKLEEMLNVALALRGTQIGNQSIPPLEVAAIRLFSEMMTVFGPVPDPDVAIDEPIAGEEPARPPSLMQQHDAYLSGMLRPAFQQTRVDPAYALAAFELVSNAVAHGATMSVGKNIRSLAPKSPLGRRVVVGDATDVESSHGLVLVCALDGSNNYRTKTTLAVTDYPGTNLCLAVPGDDSDDEEDGKKKKKTLKSVADTGTHGATRTVLLLAQLRVLSRIWFRSSTQHSQSKTNLHLSPSSLGAVHRLCFAAVCDFMVLQRGGGKKTGRRLCLQLSRYEDVDQVRDQYDHSWALATYGAAVTISHVTQAEAESNFPLLFSIIIRAMSGDNAGSSDADTHICLEAFRLLAEAGGSDAATNGNRLSFDDAQRALHALSLCLSQRVGEANDLDEKSVDVCTILHSAALTLRRLAVHEHAGRLSCALLECATLVLEKVLDQVSAEADLNRIVNVCLECGCLVAQACAADSKASEDDHHSLAAAAGLLLQLLQSPVVAQVGKSVREQMSTLIDRWLVWVAAPCSSGSENTSVVRSSNAVCALVSVLLKSADVVLQSTEPSAGQVSMFQWLLKALHQVSTTVPEYVTQDLHFRTQQFVVDCMRASDSVLVSAGVQCVASYVRTAHQYAGDTAQQRRFCAACNYTANVMSEVTALFFAPHNGDSKRLQLRAAALQLMCSLLQARSTVLGEEGKAALLRLVLQLAVGVSARLSKQDNALSITIGKSLLGLAASAKTIFKQQVAALASGPRVRLQTILQQAVISSKRRQVNTSHQSVKLSIS